MSMGWTWKRPSSVKGANDLTDAEKTCEQMLDLLETNNPDPEQVKQKIESLRRVREQISRELQQAQQ